MDSEGRTRLIMNRLREEEERVEEVLASTSAPAKLVTWVPRLKPLKPRWARE